jgi:hypothetical protein
MNCRSCNLDDAKKAQQAALTLLKTPGNLPKVDIDKAVACCECASKMLSEDATKRMGVL